MRVLLAALPLLPFLPAASWFAAREGSWRMGFVLAATSWGTAVVVITEGLTLVGAFTPGAVAMAWVAGTVLAGAAWARRPGPEPAGIRPAMTKAASRARAAFRSLAPFERVLAGAVAAWLAGTGLVALVAAPNNWDSMTYHMSRVAHWAHQAGVSHYPTHILRQLFPPPWAGFAILQFQVLSGGDRFANLVQFAALCGCVVNVSLIAARLSAGPRGQALAAAACATLPVAILEGTSTQNDLVAAFWLSCFAALVCDRTTRGGGRLDVAGTLALGASLGLALLTKGTSYLLCLGFAALTLRFARPPRGARGLVRLALIAAVAAVLNAGHVGRNLAAFGRPLAPRGGLPVIMETLTPQIAASNVLRNAAVHFDTPVVSWTLALREAVDAAHRALGVDVGDPRITRGPPVPVVKLLRLHEDVASNPIHLLLALAAGGALAFAGPPPVRAYVAALFLSSAAFCLGLKWQIWITRLQLPLFVLACPLLGVAAARVRPGVGRAVALVLLAASAPYVVANETRSLVGRRSILVLPRHEQYFENQRPLFAPYERAARDVATAGCAEAGLVLGPNDFEYPLWVLLAAQAGRPLALRHLDVTDAPETALARHRPCAMVAIGLDRIPGLTRTLGRPPEWVEDPVSFWTSPSPHRRSRPSPD